MAMRAAATAIVVLTMAGAGAAWAADKPNTVPRDSCTAKAPPPAEMTAWSSPVDLPAAASEAGLRKAQLAPGMAINAALDPVDKVQFRVPPEKADGPATFGGLYSLKIVQAGTYRIASNAAPWMDVFAAKIPVTSIAHSHGPACTGIGKMVDFPLGPGDYLVQFSESLSPKTEIMVVKLTP